MTESIPEIIARVRRLVAQREHISDVWNALDVLQAAYAAESAEPRYGESMFDGHPAGRVDVTTEPRERKHFRSNGAEPSLEAQLAEAMTHYDVTCRAYLSAIDGTLENDRAREAYVADKNRVYGISAAIAARVSKAATPAPEPSLEAQRDAAFQRWRKSGNDSPPLGAEWGEYRRLHEAIAARDAKGGAK